MNAEELGCRGVVQAQEGQRLPERNAAHEIQLELQLMFAPRRGVIPRHLEIHLEPFVRMGYGLTLAQNLVVTPASHLPRLSPFHSSPRGHWSWACLQCTDHLGPSEVPLKAASL